MFWRNTFTQRRISIPHSIGDFSGLTFKIVSGNLVELFLKRIFVVYVVFIGFWRSVEKKNDERKKNH
jgi:hypothetical protein